MTDVAFFSQSKAFSSSTDDWATPRDMYDRLHAEFDFRVDVCASESNAKCRLFFSEEDDGLTRDWALLFQRSGGRICLCRCHQNRAGPVESESPLRSSPEALPPETDSSRPAGSAKRNTQGVECGGAARTQWSASGSRPRKDAISRASAAENGSGRSPKSRTTKECAKPPTSHSYGALSAGANALCSGTTGAPIVMSAGNSPTIISSRSHIPPAPEQCLGTSFQPANRATAGSTTPTSSSGSQTQTDVRESCATCGDCTRVIGPAFVNPPYGRGIGAWVEKAATCGALVVALLPSRTDTRWWHEHIQPILDGRRVGEVRFIRGRLKFGGAKNSAPFPSVVVVFRPSGRQP